MGIFGKKYEGGFMDVIRCDKKDYLIWKWSPSGSFGSSDKENSIRYGSSLRVKDGEVAVFVYTQENGTVQDFIIGPCDTTIKTSNLPILTSIVGLAFGGDSPFQAEIYFINLSGNLQLKFGVPFFDVFDPRYTDFAVPIAARGTITFNITNYQEFIKLNRLVNFEIEDLNKQVKDTISKYVKNIISNLPIDKNIPVLQIERKLLEINEIVAKQVQPRLEKDFGINIKAIDFEGIEADKSSNGYAELMKITAEQVSKTTFAQTEVNIKNIQDLQQLNIKNTEEALKIQREEAQRLQKLQTETNYISTHSMNQQAEVLKKAAESLGSMSAMDSGSDGGMNPAGMMTGMMMGSALGNQMVGMMNNLNQTNTNTPPPPPISQYMLHQNGQNLGPYTLTELTQLIQQGQVSQKTYVWKQGMANWELAGNIQEITSLFGMTPPPPPTI
jgi:membrane protease subunit (stomatin/prohibitin family)